MVKLYISTFNNDVSWIKKGIPIEVGADIRDTFRYELRDNTGDNISSENAYFGELTGLYWIWKNEHFGDSDIIGFCHYNKCLDITDESLETLFKEESRNLWVCPETIKSGAHTYPEDITVLQEVLSTYYPAYYKTWETLYTSAGESYDSNRHLMQIFYTSKWEFERYCDFLFGVLFKVRDMIGDVDRAPFDKRYCALLGERLLDIYTVTNECNVMAVKKRTNANGIRKIIHACGFLAKNSFIRSVYMKFRTSGFYDRFLNDGRSSWKK